jgi:hypothetical protein
MVFYHHFTLLMDRSPSFGSTSCNSDALFRLALAAASDLQSLTSLHNVTRRSVLQKVRDRTFNVLSLLVNTGFQVLFHSPPGVLFTFPSRYYALSVTRDVFRLGGWSPRLPTGFLVSCGTLDPDGPLWISRTGFLPSLIPLPNGFCYPPRYLVSVHNPEQP